MYFEIVGSITAIQRIAAGPSIRDVARLRRQYGAVAGESSKVLPQCASAMVGYDVSNCIGMKLTAWEKGR